MQLIREHNTELRRCVFRELKRENGDCSGDCDNCRLDMDNHISRKELSDVFGVSENVIFNWESGRTVVDYENLLFYAQLSKKELQEIVIFEN